VYLKSNYLFIVFSFHLFDEVRFEPDMLAFSGCYYGGGDKERAELGEIRKRWATLPVLSLSLSLSHTHTHTQSLTHILANIH
jgi:hypothetical protein